MRRAEKGVARLAEHPLRTGELSGMRTKRPNRAVAALVAAGEVPPAVTGGDKIEHAVGRPLRLADRLGLAARDLAPAPQAAVLGELGDPQLGADPRHVGVVPLHPGQAAAVRRQPWRGVEVAALGQYPPGAGLP